MKPDPIKLLFESMEEMVKADKDAAPVILDLLLLFSKKLIMEDGPPPIPDFPDFNRKDF